jgi:hypothetical protein
MGNNALMKYKENQAQVGYGSAIFYKETGETKYKFLVASETVPFPFGSNETFEYNLMNAETIGQVEGKATLEQKEVELLYTRDNAVMFENLRGRVLDFMSVTPQKVGFKFSGTITFRPNDASNDIHRGTYVITPMSADTTPYYMAREEVKTPLFFADVIPEEISIKDLGTTATGVKVSVGLSNGYANAEFSYDTFVKSTNKPTGTPTDVTATNGIIELPKTTGLYIVYAKPQSSDEDTYSGCFTTVYVVE